tara:strand:- start:634 stop:2304 length:1671 start_codon:yes stop_codon:yes gene_type:complete
MAKQTIDIGTTANDGTGTLLRDAFDMVNDNFNELYTDDTNDVNSIIATAPIARNNATGIVTISLNDNGVDAAKLNVTGNGSNGQALTSDGDGSFSWTTMEVGDITAVTAGAGLTGGGTAGDITLNAIAGNSITVNADSIQVTDSGITATQLASDAVITAKILNANVTADKLASDSVITAKILNDNVTIDKMANDSVGSDELVDNSVGAAALNVSGNGTAGYILKSDGDGSFSWIANDQGDLTAIVAGSGLTGTDLSGPIPTLNIGAGTGITVAADAISLTNGGVTATQLGANSATPAKVSLFDDNTVATDTHILVADGTDYINKAVSGDATLANTGALTIAADAVTYAKMQNLGTANRLLGSTSTGVIGETQVVSAMMAANSVDSDSYVDGSIDTAHIADSQITVGKMAANSVNSDQYVDGSIDTVHIADNNITHAKLENRYTEVVTIANTSGSPTVNWSSGAVFVMANSLAGSINFNFTNFKVGQTIDIYNITGSQTVSLDSNAATSSTYNKCGGVDYDGGSGITNLIQVQCVNDSANAVFNYAVSAYVSDTTPS